MASPSWRPWFRALAQYAAAGKRRPRPARKSKPRPFLERLEDRTAPAVSLIYGGAGSALILTEGATGATPSVTVSEVAANDLRINLNGATFAAGSTAAAGGLTYQTPGNPTASTSADVNITATNQVTTLVANLPGDFLSLGPINDVNGGLGNLNVSANFVFVPAGVTIDTTHAAAGAGNIALTADTIVQLNSGSTLLVKDGSITLRANQGAAPTGGNFIGVDDSGGTVETTGAGNILLQGTGANDTTTGSHMGILIGNAGATGAMVAATGSGSVTLNGTGGLGTADSFGVDITGTNTAVKSAAGNVTITGVGGRGSAATSFDVGVQIANGAQVAATGSAAITITGTGGSGTGSDFGVDVVGTNTLITSAGTVQISGTGGGNGSATVEIGTDVGNGAQVTGTGGVTLEGQGGRGTGADFGVVLDGTNGTQVTSAGFLRITGTGGGTGAGTNEFGVLVSNGARASTTGAAPLTITGTGGAGTGGDFGVDIADAGTVVSSATGPVDVTGTGGPGAGSTAVSVLSSAQISTAGAPITLTGDSLAIAGTAAVSAPGNVVTLQPLTPGTQINLGGSNAAGTLGLTTAELNAVSAGALHVGSAAGGPITVSGPVSSATTSTLTLLTGSSITGTGALTVTDLRTDSAGPVSLTGANAVAVLAARTGGASPFTFTDSGPLTVGTVENVSGIDTAGGDITLTAGGLLTLGTGAGEGLTAPGAVVDLDAAGVTEDTNSTVSAAALRLRGAGTFSLTQLNAVSTLAASTTGTVTYTSAAALGIGTVFGTAGITTGGQDLTLVTDAGDLTVSAPVQAGAGTLDLTAAGAILGTGGNPLAGAALAVQAAAAVGSAAVPLPTAVGTLAVSTTGDVFVANQGDLTLGTVHGVTGVTVTNGAVGISSSGGLTVAGGVQASGGVSLAVGAGGDGGALTVAGTVTGTTVTARGGAGDDTLALDYTGGASLPVGLSWDGGGGANALDLSDQGGAAGHAYQATGASVVRDHAAALTYTHVSSVSITGGDSAAGDRFDVTPSAATTFTLAGGNPAAPPGDTLDVKLGGTTNPNLADTALSGPTFAGTWTFGNRQPVDFTGMETLTPSSAPSAAGGTGGTTAAVPTGTITVLRVLRPAPRAGRVLDLSATTVGGAAAPTGVILYFEVVRHKRRALGEAPLADGVARLRKALPAGRHVLVALYTGDSSSLPSTSSLLVVTVR